MKRGAFQLLTRTREFIGSTRIRDGVLAALLSAAIIVNAFQFDDVSGSYRAFPSYETADITKLAQAGRLGYGYGPFFELGRRFPGSTVVLSRSQELGSEFEASILSYGRAAHVAWATYEAEQVLSGLDYERFVLAEGKYGRWHRNRFTIATGPNPKVFLALRQQATTILLDLSLLLEARSTSRD